jgi:hypothetical protein
MYGGSFWRVDGGMAMKSMEHHGMSKSPEYKIWMGIKVRAYSYVHHNSSSYRENGISMCPEWVDSFLAFYNHVGPRPSPRHSIDRIDTTKWYEPGNVRWTTKDVQARNMRTNLMLTYGARTLCITDWSRLLGISRCVIKNRLNKLGWSVEKTLSTPTKPLLELLNGQQE